MTDTTKALIGVGVALALALAAVATLVAVVRDLKSGRDGRIARAIAFFRRVSITTGKWLTFVDLLLWTAKNLYY